MAQILPMFSEFSKMLIKVEDAISMAVCTTLVNAGNLFRVDCLVPTPNKTSIRAKL